MFGRPEFSRLSALRPESVMRESVLIFHVPDGLAASKIRRGACSGEPIAVIRHGTVVTPAGWQWHSIRRMDRGRDGASCKEGSDKG